MNEHAMEKESIQMAFFEMLETLKRIENRGEKVLSLEEAAEEANCRVTYIKILIKEGLLPRAKFSQKTQMVMRSDLHKALKLKARQDTTLNKDWLEELEENIIG